MSSNRLAKFHELSVKLRQEYESVEQRVDALFCDVTSTTDALEKINSLLDQVKLIESQVQPIRESLNESGESLPAETRLVVDETIQMVSRILPKVGELTQAAVEAKEKLAPKIHAGVQALKMQSAYTKKHA